MTFVPLLSNIVKVSSKVEVVDGWIYIREFNRNAEKAFHSFQTEVMHHNGKNVMIVSDGYPTKDNLWRTKRADRD